MISIYLHPDYTQIVRGRMRKNHILDIQYNSIYKQSYLNALEHDASADDLARLFYDVKEMTDVAGEEIYLVLPDYLFTVIDCFRYEKDEDIENHICNTTMQAIDQFYYSSPIITQPEQLEKVVTVCVIERQIVNRLVQAAEQERVQLSSIEAASIAFLRGMGTFSKEAFFYHGDSTHATLIGYSPIAGMFKMDVPDISIDNLQKMEPSVGDETIKAAFVEFENVGINTFKFMNQDIPITQLFDQGKITLPIPVLQERQAEKHIFPTFIQSQIPESEQQDWMVAVGTLLQQVDFTDEAFQDFIDPYEKILSGNVLPRDVQKNTKLYQRMQRLFHFSRVTIMFLIGGICIEMIGIFFLSSVEIPSTLSDDYAAGQKTMPEINREIDVLAQQEKEHQYPILAMEQLLRSKPSGVGFAALEIGNDNITKSVDPKWIKLKVVAADPLMFQDYQSALASNPMFQNVIVTQITSNNNSTGLKTADFVIGKGDKAQ